MRLPFETFGFSLPSWCTAVGFRATEGKINTAQTSPGTPAIPRGILGMWLRMSGRPLLPHPEKCPRSLDPMWRASSGSVCVCVCVYQSKQAERPHPTLWALPSGVPTSAGILTWNADLKLATLAEPPLDDAAFPRRQRDLQPHKQLEVGLLLEQVASDHGAIVGHLSGREQSLS